MTTQKKSIISRPKKMAVVAGEEQLTELYDKDFCKWTSTQSKLLRKGEYSKLDIQNLIEEIEALGRNDKRSLRSYIIVLLMHMLKQKYQPEKQENSDSWNSSILNSKREIKFLIEDSPSLGNELIKIYPQAYEDARQDAAVETKLNIKTFPEECPWKIEEILPFIKKKKHS